MLRIKCEKSAVMTLFIPCNKFPKQGHSQRCRKVRIRNSNFCPCFCHYLPIHQTNNGPYQIYSSTMGVNSSVIQIYSTGRAIQCKDQLICSEVEATLKVHVF